MDDRSSSWYSSKSQPTYLDYVNSSGSTQKAYIDKLYNSFLDDISIYSDREEDHN
jgi:hypothetical protein